MGQAWGISGAFSSDADQLPGELRRRLAGEAERVKLLLGPNYDRKVLLIGGSGYIGGTLASHLLRTGYKVRNLDLLVYRHSAAMFGVLPHPQYEFQFGDFGDADTLDRALEGVTDVVILGGLVGDPVTKNYPEESRAINEVALRNCIHRLNGRGLNKVVFISTCSNYGLVEDGILADELFELKPLSLYAKAKVAAEHYLLSLKSMTDYHATILRFATAFGVGPRMRFDLTVNEFTRDLFVKQELVVFDAHTWRPYCHVQDFARLIGSVLVFPAEDVAFEVFNAGGEQNNYTKQNIVDIIREKLPKSHVEFQKNSSDPRNYKVNFTKVKNTLHFTPRYSVSDGVDEILRALRNKLFGDVESQINFYTNNNVYYDLRQMS